jgi:hypothetical protein
MFNKKEAKRGGKRMSLVMEYGCKECIEDIIFYFEGPPWRNYQPSREQEEAQNRALAHMTAGSTHGKHNIACQNCWYYYEAMKRKYCGG